MSHKILKRLGTHGNLILILFVLVASNAFAVNEQIPKVTPKYKLDKVTVFFTGAEMNFNATTNLKKGRNLVIFENVSDKFREGSIRASFDNSVKILQVTTGLKEFEFDESAINRKQDSIDFIERNLKRLDLKSSSYKTERTIITKNVTRVGGEVNVTPQDLSASMSLCRNKLKELDDLLFEIELEYERLISLQKELEFDIIELNSKKRAAENAIESKNIIIEVEAKQPTSVKSKISYLVSGAGWSPKYDIRAYSVEQPVTLEYKANVFNNTQIDWSNIQLELSTASQNYKLERPELGYAWALDYKSKSSSDFSGEGLLSSSQLKRESDENNVDYTKIEVPELDLVFDIDAPAFIQADKKPHVVSIGSFELPTSYKFYTVPKVDDNVYKIAAIQGWERLNLIEGESSIYLNEAYLGDSYLNPKYSDKEMKISLGVDPKIQISRVKKEDKEAETTIGTNRTVNLTYNIDVRNNYSKPVEIEIVDQAPISNEDDIEVSILELSKAKMDEQNGKLVWNEKLKGNEFKKYTLSFEVKFPRTKSVSSFTLFRVNRGGVICPKFR